MNALQKVRMKAILKYTWPFYILSGIIVGFLMYFLFGITHRVPSYQTLTLFVSGETINSKKLKNDMLEKYKDNGLKAFSCVSADPSQPNSYYNKLSVAGYNTSDVLIITGSQLDNLNVSAFALDLNDELINSYYSGMTLYAQEGVNYGIELDKEKVKDYFALPSETCYLVLNGKSVNTGAFSPKQVKEYDNALRIVRDWGK